MLRTGAMRVHLAVALTFAGAHAASAEPRFHRLTPQLAARLAPKARSGLASVVELRDASGFLVHADAGSGRALLLTNEHVTRGGLASPEPVHFFDGAVEEVDRLGRGEAPARHVLVGEEERAARPGVGVDEEAGGVAELDHRREAAARLGREARGQLRGEAVEPRLRARGVGAGERERDGEVDAHRAGSQQAPCPR